MILTIEPRHKDIGGGFTYSSTITTNSAKYVIFDNGVTEPKKYRAEISNISSDNYLDCVFAEIKGEHIDYCENNGNFTDIIDYEDFKCAEPKYNVDMKSKYEQWTNDIIELVVSRLERFNKDI